MEVDSDMGDALFEKVAEIEPALCAQITGMLLELDDTILSDLIDTPDDLIQAVEKAKLAYLEYQTSSTSVVKCTKVNSNAPSLEFQKLGEQVYQKVFSAHPEDASHITGMILEMSQDQIKLVLSQENLLTETIQKAYNALHS